MVSTAEVLEVIRGADLPKSKSELMDLARSRNASSDVMDILSKLPDRRFESAGDITQAVGDVR